MTADKLDPEVCRRLAGAAVLSDLPEVAAQLTAAAGMAERAAEIRRRVTRLTLAAGLPREVWSELCHLDTALSALLGTSIDRAAVAPAQPAPQVVAIGLADTAIIDAALGYWSSDYNDAPHEDIARIRAQLTGTVLS